MSTETPEQVGGYLKVLLDKYGMIDEVARRIRFGTCKRSASRLRGDLDGCLANIAVFLNEHRQYDRWTVERFAIAPMIEEDARRELETRGFVAQDLRDLTAGL